MLIFCNKSYKTNCGFNQIICCFFQYFQFIIVIKHFRLSLFHNQLSIYKTYGVNNVIQQQSFVTQFCDTVRCHRLLYPLRTPRSYSIDKTMVIYHYQTVIKELSPTEFKLNIIVRKNMINTNNLFIE